MLKFSEMFNLESNIRLLIKKRIYIFFYKFCHITDNYIMIIIIRSILRANFDKKHQGGTSSSFDPGSTYHK